MIEFVDTSPAVNVPDAEYARLLGFPPGAAIEGRAAELARWARQWYSQHGRPWIAARAARRLERVNGSIVIENESFTSRRLQEMLWQSEAHAAVLVAVSAGGEIEAQAQEKWREEKPDEYFFLEMYGSAVVEHLITLAGARLCAWADAEGLAVLPHYSPGYAQWSIADQPRLLALLRRGFRLPGELDCLDSGMLRPRKSLLGVFGLTRALDRIKPLADLVPCSNCSFAPCQYRRAPYRLGGERGPIEEPAAPVHSNSPRYTTNTKALSRWASERLSLNISDDGVVHALFRYDGTTCTNLGQPLSFIYRVTLGPREAGYPIRESACAPAPGDFGHRSMCKYISGPEVLMSAIDSEKPLLDRPLEDVLNWPRPAAPAGCFCDPASRMHKWGLVLETIHYALARLPAESKV